MCIELGLIRRVYPTDKHTNILILLIYIDKPEALGIISFNTINTVQPDTECNKHSETNNVPETNDPIIKELLTHIWPMFPIGNIAFKVTYFNCCFLFWVFLLNNVIG